MAEDAADSGIHLRFREELLGFRGVGSDGVGGVSIEKKLGRVDQSLGGGFSGKQGDQFEAVALLVSKFDIHTVHRRLATTGVVNGTLVTLAVTSLEGSELGIARKWRRVEGSERSFVVAAQAARTSVE